MKEAIVRLLDAEGEALRVSVLEQPVRPGGYHVFLITQGNLANLLADAADAAARRVRRTSAEQS